ncbi:hypothetical protein CYMTET_28738 [Cymbomonas tetramitiformis]|uniref:Mitochondrial carrier protein n=1 Tax=Cymbomonas tetramitiformis TaxID=36881 RepID=A0AAE0FMH8_9CHLO|nr:hypothetical protein CYMTET_28738 [Cymbomonas tetramitiformis]
MPNPGIEIMAGMFSGIADACATHPIDQIKTQFHVNKGANPSIFKPLAEQYKLGGFSRLYSGRGLLPACLRPQSLCMYTGNEWSKRFIAGDGELTYWTAPVAGFLTGYIEAATVTPFEVVKVRMQSLDHVSRYSNSMNCAANIVRSEGILALYNGFGPSCARNCTFNGAYFGFIFWFKDQLPTPKGFGEEVAKTLFTGMAGGVFATCIKQPFDVVKSRFQNQLPDANGNKEYRYTLQALVSIYRKEGIAALYKGFTPTVLRMTIGQSVALTAFETSTSLMERISEGKT